MAIRTKAWVSAAAAMLLVVACKEPLDVGVFSVSGQWKGTAKQLVGADSVAYNFVLDLDQNEHDVTGSATIQHGSETVDANVDGDWDYPDVTLRFTAPGFARLDYPARFATRDTLRGPITGSGFSATTLTIVRQ